jgi:hypothetical protein
MEAELKYEQKSEISLVTQLPVDFSKFNEYRKMHKLLRHLRLNNEPLPESQQ